MPVETLLIVLAAATLCIIAYLAAGHLYEWHYKLKADGNPLSKIVTGDRKKIDDKTLWVKRYRIKVLILLALVIIVPIIRFWVG